MNDKPMGTIAPLQNVAIAMHAMERAVNRPKHLPGFVCVYGPSGWGKSTGAAYVMNKMDALYVEAKAAWTIKALLEAIALEAGLAPQKTIYRMSAQVSNYLAQSGRPLIVDEMDHLVNKRSVEIIRDLHDASGAPILLIGEERLPDKLGEWEQLHGRVLEWFPAQPANISDGSHLRELYCDRVEVGDQLLERIVEVARGSVRRICVNLERVQEVALGDGLDQIDLGEWGDRQLFTGQAPSRPRRVA